MINGFKVITLCGSTRFKDEFLETQKRLTLEGNIVISVGLFGHSGDDVVWTEGVKDMLDRQHLAKIDLADEIYVINVGGYIGDSTRREIAYAEYRGKSITYLESCIKPSLYDNYDALGELYDAKRISCSNMALFPLITTTSKISTMQIAYMKFALKEKAPMMKSNFRALLILSEVNIRPNYVPQRKSL